MLVPICCMFFVSQKIHIKRSPNAIKFNGDFLEYICFFGARINARGPWAWRHPPRDMPGELVPSLEVDWRYPSGAKEIILGNIVM